MIKDTVLITLEDLDTDSFKVENQKIKLKQTQGSSGSNTREMLDTVKQSIMDNNIYIFKKLPFEIIKGAYARFYVDISEFFKINPKLNEESYDENDPRSMSDGNNHSDQSIIEFIQNKLSQIILNFYSENSEFSKNSDWLTYSNTLENTSINYVLEFSIDTDKTKAYLTELKSDYNSSNDFMDGVVYISSLKPLQLSISNGYYGSYNNDNFNDKIPNITFETILGQNFTILIDSYYGSLKMLPEVEGISIKSIQAVIDLPNTKFNSIDPDYTTNYH